MNKFKPFRLLSIALGLFLAPLALGDDLNQANTAWIMTSTALVLFMTIPGLSLFYAGLVRVKNVLSVLIQCFAITCLVSILWLIVGYSLAFSEGNAFIGVMLFWGQLCDLFPDYFGFSIFEDLHRSDENQVDSEKAKKINGCHQESPS